jgi:hypothetical protein
MRNDDFDYAAFGLNPDQFLTRDGIVSVAEKLGVPLKKSELEKKAWRGIGPPVDAVAGKRHLTKTRNAVPYLLGLLREPERAA